MSINSQLRCSLRGKNFIKKFEALSSTSPSKNIWVSNPNTYTGKIYAYWDSVGKKWTIGWGHTGKDVYKGKVITKKQADNIFDKDVTDKAERFVKRYIKVPLTQNQFDALCSFTYNAGNQSLLDSKIRKFVNKKQWREAYSIWLESNTSGGNTHLIKRRRAEADLFIEELSVEDGEDVGIIKVHEIEEVEPEEVVKEQFIEYVHSGGIKKIEDLLQSDNFIVEGNRVTKGELLSVTYLGKTNHRRLFDNLDRIQKVALSGNYGSFSFFSKVEYNPKVDYPITDGAILIIPNSKVDIGLKFESKLTVESSYSDYFPAILRVISQDPGYRVENRTTKETIIKDKHSAYTLYGWSKVLYFQEENTGYFDLTKYILSVNISNNIKGDSVFSVELAPVEGIYVDEKWKITGEIDLKSSELESSEVISLSNINKFNGFSRRRSKYYFQEVFQENDLMFISFERLGIEGDKRTVPNNWYDMIGMIDSVSVNTSPNGQISISVSGRNLSKGLQNDNSYFNPYSFGVIPFNNGRYLDGKFYDLDAITTRSIRDSVEFIFHRISSVEYVPSDIFSGFSNLTVVTKSGITSSDNVIETIENTELLKNVHKEESKELGGIWQIIKVFVDRSVSDFRIVDDSISNPNGSVFDLFMKLCQDPFVELFTDTYGDKHYIIIRRPPFSFDDVNEALSSLTVPPEFREYSEVTLSQVQMSLDEDDLVVEENSTIQLNTAEVSKFPQMLLLGEEDVLEERLQYSSLSYAWYQLSDIGNFSGQQVNLGVYPGVYIDEFAQVFGNNRLSVTSNYSNKDFFTDNKSTDSLDLYAKHASELLAWLIETNIYLPFTREGTIVIAGGDRRFRVGNWFYYKPTNEIFYIKGVTNSLNVGGLIDRVTVLQVERGMIKDFVLGVLDKDDQETLYSYFTIMNIQEFKKKYYEAVTQGSLLTVENHGSGVNNRFDQKSVLKLNDKVFKFFLRRRQTSY